MRLRRLGLLGSLYLSQGLPFGFFTHPQNFTSVMFFVSA